MQTNQQPVPAESFSALRERVERLLLARLPSSSRSTQLRLDFASDFPKGAPALHPSHCIGDFLDFMTSALPYGDVYLFGGLLRDVALFGTRGFDSDVDLVVEGDWYHCMRYLKSVGAMRNRFGGFRFSIGDRPVDIWNARDTWAITYGHVPYRSIASLTETTVLNWDAILMNWRTREFICRHDYLTMLRERVLDVVLEANPNPLGMAVRVFRHLSLKSARKITRRAARYLTRTALNFSFKEIHEAEFRSYGVHSIPANVYEYFKRGGENLDAHFVDAVKITTGQQQLV